MLSTRRSANPCSGIMKKKLPRWPGRIFALLALGSKQPARNGGHASYLVSTRDKNFAVSQTRQFLAFNGPASDQPTYGFLKRSLTPI